ncbi:type III polyketide synthase [Microlunatus flavus]|uniref:Predicted naringenin-chalcone synthase n=1 Tax=Microlunatus flavus TaxID=1036181 RepID=A0A1H9G4S7_9ACTN|nr:type III polyketide synthase [Microlunatus flavus]SEQ45119.1 Predicted naringenin-chalcone synthase [Microlunatus flavus]
MSPARSDAPVHLRALGTAVPVTVLRQPDLRDLLAEQPGLSRLGLRRLHATFDASGIETRHTVVDEFAQRPAASEPVLVDATARRVLSPSTGTRNGLYVRHAPGLFLDAAKQALASTDLTPDDVTHVVTVSCTGFFAPGPDHVLVRQLGLAPTTQRFHLGFMGCYGAFPALRLADAVCRADPEAVVLVVCAELCSLHLHLGDDLDTVLASSLFADGAAAAVLSGRPPGPGEDVVTLDALGTTLSDEGEADMTWSIGDQGFDMVLTRYVPRILGSSLPAAVPALLGDVDPADVDRWAVHPGGRSVLDHVQTALGLDDEAMAASRAVLRRYGNMSSATVLFVLADLLAQPAGATERLAAMAFGPGLTVESALLTRRMGA